MFFEQTRIFRRAYRKDMFFQGGSSVRRFHRTDTNFFINPYLVLEHILISQEPYLVLEHIQFSRRPSSP